MKIVESKDRRAVDALLSAERTRDAATDARVATIVANVRRKGERALLQYAKSLDRLSEPIEVSRSDMKRTAVQVPSDVRAAIRAAARNIRTVAVRQVPRSWRVRVTGGVTVEQRVVPLDRVGCYVPGGRYPLPSSLLMTAIPAIAAGVREVVAVCPRPEPVVMAAALEAVYRLQKDEPLPLRGAGAEATALAERHALMGHAFLGALYMETRFWAEARSEFETGLARSPTPESRAVFARSLAELVERQAAR